MLVDRSGHLVWFDPQPKSTFDVKIQTYNGKARPHVLVRRPRRRSWRWRREDRRSDLQDESRSSGDEQKRPIDLHEFNLTSRGTALVTYWGQSQVRPLPDRGTEVRDPARRPRAGDRHRHGQGHCSTGSRSTTSASRRATSRAHPGATYTDYFHINSIAEAADGNLLISGRNTWAVYKVNRKTGEVMWRLNGKRSDFRLDQNADFSWQHHVRAHGRSELTVFNNAATSGHGSLGLLLDVNETSKRARLKQLTSIRRSSWPGRSAASQGVRPDGKRVHRLGLPALLLGVLRNR